RRAVERTTGELGCAVGPLLPTTVGMQAFQGGRMVDWHGIYVLQADGLPWLCRWSGVPDPFGDTAPAQAVPPPSGLIAPQDGPGKVWRDHYGGPGGDLGWATEAEHSE